ncbi:MAG: hypothetical protein JWM91_3878 [Rhodospirillales bacterium]|nr:hypothetical protein [Rhodospirillales bacterium]
MITALSAGGAVFCFGSMTVAELAHTAARVPPIARPSLSQAMFAVEFYGLATQPADPAPPMI